MNNSEKDSALLVAEYLMEYSRKKERQKQLQQEQYLAHKKEVRQMKRYMILLSGVGAVILCLCVGMISLAMQVKEREERITELRVEVSELKKANKESERRMRGQVDYRWIREEAEKLGMSDVTEDRVIYYSIDDADYMVQYDSIPTS